MRMWVKEVYNEVEKEYSEILEQKEKSITLLKQRVTILAKEMEKEREKHQVEIKETIDKVRKQWSDDLWSYMDKKWEIAEDLEFKNQDELKWFKDRLQMEIEFEMHQHIEAKEQEFKKEKDSLEHLKEK